MGKMLKREFCEAYKAAPFLVVLGNTVLVHGAMAPAMLRTRSLPRKLRSLALYGEATSTTGVRQAGSNLSLAGLRASRQDGDHRSSP